MSGELIVNKGNGGKSRFLTLVVTLAVTALVMWPMMKVLNNRGQVTMLMQASIAILVPVLSWVLFQKIAPRITGEEGTKTLPWTLTEEALDLGGDVIPRGTIKRAYCWKKNGVWMVNIETTGKNRLLRSADGPEQAESVERLNQLVTALGYADSWFEF